MSPCASDSAVLKSLREHLPPLSSCSFKIDKLSELSNNKHDFVSCGYTWSLVVYTKGNEQDNGKGYVSMYVELDNKGLSSSPNDVFAYLTFFVFNKKDNKYLSVQDVEVKRFNSSKTVWGLSQVLSLETFNDRKNGYIFDGEQCEFGAHVKIASPPQVDENLPFHKFLWSVRDFSLLKEKDCVSKSFSMGGKNWVLKMYPKGESSGDDKVPLYLHLDDREKLARGEMLSVRVGARILDPRGSNHQTVSLNMWVMASTRAWGMPQYFSLAEIQEGYLDLEDTLSVEIECEVCSRP
ncbi:unnamed protein product [Cochlearia groenlandica]